MPIEYLLAWIMIFMRSLGVVLQLPTLVGHPIPIPMRVGLCVMLAVLLSGIVPAAPVPLDPWRLTQAVTGELLLGLALGFVVRMTFAVVETAGRLIASEIGLMAQPGFGVPEPSSEPLAALLTALALVLFFLLGAHHDVLTALARSFHLAPAGRAALDMALAETLIRGSGRLIEMAFRIAAPFIAMNFLVTLAFSILSRAVPKTNVFILSMPARALIGLSLLGAAGSLVARYLYIEFSDMPLRMLEILPTR